MLTLKVYLDPGHEDGTYLVAEGADLPALLAGAFRMFSEIYSDAATDPAISFCAPSAMSSEFVPAGTEGNGGNSPARFLSTATLFEYIGRTGGRTWAAEIFHDGFLVANLLED